MERNVAATVINDTEHRQVIATLGERWLMQPDEFADLTGWTLKPEGMCKGDVCAPLRNSNEIVSADGLIDLVAAAPVIGLAAVADPDRGVAAITASAAGRAEEMTSLQAPDFTLPDLNGRPVSLHDFDRRKVLLLAWSSW